MCIRDRKSVYNSLYVTNLDMRDFLFKDVYQERFSHFHRYSPHIGYVNLFPMFFGVMKPNSREFKSLLRTMSDEDLLWSKWGLRSLSKDDIYYGQGDNYWRGNIWININYLALRGLRQYYWSDSEAVAIYKKLRINVLTNVISNWRRTGFLWENYDAITGEGRRNHPFCGWTSLAVLILGEEY
eukprot:TRINITY_DN20563_c0_g1_i1.p1 TRINITY_DN20563_c0_g1~~TRINITY_DN20563_c0_g1_i1.p1  ORF type:complete len:202 (+),score=29.58 TRINITY_DN20563_c0_g1_i1:60-608(+)